MRHRFHALCPYFAMFPEAFAEEWISRLTKRGDAVLDPFSGRGTAPFQALLMGRAAVAIDVSPVAYCITKAKTNSPTRASVKRRLTQLRASYELAEWLDRADEMPPFFAYAYRRETLAQLLFLRDRLKWQRSDTDCMIAALVLGSLHGESQRSPSYLSNQMPHAISTKPDYSVRYWKRHGLKAPKRDAFELITTRLDYRYVSDPPEGRAQVFNTDMRALPEVAREIMQPIRCVVTSPPYFDVTNFEEDQWLRNWFLGGPAHPTYHRLTRDNRHETSAGYWGLIADMWRGLGHVLAKGAHVVIRFGSKGVTPEYMIDVLSATTVFANRKTVLKSSHVSEIRNRQTDTFRPGATGCLVEVDCHFRMA